MKNRRKNVFLLSSACGDLPDDFHPVVVGKICSAYGILGCLKIVSFTEQFHNIMHYQPWYVKLCLEWKFVYLEYWNRYRDDFRFVVKLKGIVDRDVAQLLNNHEIFANILQFPVLCKGEYYWRDIIGFQVIGISGDQFGVVVDLIETGSNDVLVVQNRDQQGAVDRVCLIPFIVDTVIKDINELDRVINVNWHHKY